MLSDRFVGDGGDRRRRFELVEGILVALMSCCGEADVSHPFANRLVVSFILFVGIPTQNHCLRDVSSKGLFIDRWKKKAIPKHNIYL